MPSNIERSAFVKRDYVGYAASGMTYRITARRDRRGRANYWVARAIGSSSSMTIGRTLDEIGTLLKAL